MRISRSKRSVVTSSSIPSPGREVNPSAFQGQLGDVVPLSRDIAQVWALRNHLLGEREIAGRREQMSRRIVYLKMVLEDHLLLIRHVDLVRKHAIEDWIAQAKHEARAEGEVNVDASLDQPQAAVRLVDNRIETVDRMIRSPERHVGPVLHEYPFHLRHYCNDFGHVFYEDFHMQILDCRVGPRFLNLLPEMVRETLP